MKKLLEFGRKAMFYIRVLSGYEERRIRAMRLDMEKRIRESKERKEAIKRIPEQLILKEVRAMVEGMQTLKKQMDETEAAIEERFNEIDKGARSVMNVQLEGEGRLMKEMMIAMQEKALHEQAQALKNAKVHNAGTEAGNQELESSAPREASAR